MAKKQRVRTKSYDVDAVKWDGNISTLGDVQRVTESNVYHVVSDGIMIPEGLVQVGDWIINDHGTVLVVPAEMFYELYEVTTVTMED